jgi:phosphoglycerate dehydrogenase-like enzyme
LQIAPLTCTALHQVDSGALLAALQSGHVRAALDVTDPEPLPEGHPLWAAPGLIVTPHIGGAVASMRVRSYKFVVKQIERYLAGEPLENVRVHGY